MKKIKDMLSKTKIYISKTVESINSLDMSSSKKGKVYFLVVLVIVLGIVAFYFGM